MRVVALAVSALAFSSETDRPDVHAKLGEVGAEEVLKGAMQTFAINQHIVWDCTRALLFEHRYLNKGQGETGCGSTDG